MLQDVPRLITGSSHSGFKLSLLEVKEGLPSVSSNCQTWALPTVMIWNSPFPTLAWFLGGSPPQPPSSSPPCVFAFLVQFPFLSPGVLTAAHTIIGVHMHVQTLVSLCLFISEQKKLQHSSGSCLPYRWASVKPQHIQRAFDPTTAIDLVHGKAQTRLWMDPFILRMRVDKVNLSLSGWGSSESYCHCWCNMTWNIQTS